MKEMITSTQNPLVKEILVLHEKSRERNRRQLILIEGVKEISLAVAASVVFERVIFQPKLITEEQVRHLCGASAMTETAFIPASEQVYAKISYRESTGGVVILAKKPQLQLTDLSVKNNSVFIILESVEKPGNLGAICRVADGAGAAGVIVCDPRTDIFNPNAIRASLGCVFTTNVVTSDFNSVQEWLKKRSIRSYAAELTASTYYQETDLSGKIALVFGTEATGLTGQWIEGADHRIKIPMRGIIDSLNVTTSVAILTYEAMRRRNFQ